MATRTIHSKGKSYVLEENAHALQDERKHSKEFVVSRKVYGHKNSLLTDLVNEEHIRPIVSMVIAFCALIFMCVILFYLAEPSRFWEDVSTMQWATSKSNYVCISLVCFYLIAFAYYESFKLWITIRSVMCSKVADHIFLLLYIASFCLTFAVATYCIIKLELPPFSAITAANGQVQIYTKIHSFVRECSPRVLEYKPENGGKQAALYPTRWHYLYFLLVPVFIYRDTYPRTEKIHWRKLFYFLTQFFLVQLVAFCIFTHYNFVVFKNVGKQPFTKTEAVYVTAGSMLTGFMLKLLLFYGNLHCWMNITGELLRFGDREFYQDWWNSLNTQYFRKWNFVAYDFLHAYVYTDCRMLGCSKWVSKYLAFILSILSHEYILSLSLKFCYPIYSWAYIADAGIGFLIIKDRTSQYWNIFGWILMFVLMSYLQTYYTIEWYSRINCPKVETSLDFFIPRSWDPSCRKFIFA